MSLQFNPVRDFLPRGADFGIDRESLSRSQIHNARIGRASRYIPRFVYCSPQLSRTIMLKAWRFCHYDAPFPVRYEREKLDAECTVLVEKIATRNPSRYSAQLQAAVHRCRSYMGFLARLSWMAWREQPPMHAPEIAAELGMSLSQVKANLNRLAKCAQDLGFKTYEVTPPGTGQRGKRRAIDTKRVLRLWARGKTTTAIAAAIGDSGRRVRRVLKESGIVVNKLEARRRAFMDAGYRRRHRLGCATGAKRRDETLWRARVSAGLKKLYATNSDYKRRTRRRPKHVQRKKPAVLAGLL